jgi:hypothetical protein
VRKFMVLTTPPRLAAPATLTLALALALVLTLVPVLFTGGRDLAEAMTKNQCVTEEGDRNIRCDMSYGAEQPDANTGNPLYIASIAACVRQPCSWDHGEGVTGNG